MRMKKIPILGGSILQSTHICKPMKSLYLWEFWGYFDNAEKTLILFGDSIATAVVHSLCVQDVAMLCARRVLEFDMQWKRNAMPCRRGGEGSRCGAKGRKAKMRLRVASHLPPVRRVLCTSLVVPAPIVCFPPGEENREH